MALTGFSNAMIVAFGCGLVMTVVGTVRVLLRL